MLIGEEPASHDLDRRKGGPRMNEVARELLPYRQGYLALTDTHLLVVRNRHLVESLALQHLSAVTTEEAHSFRHRLWGLVAALILLAPPLGLLVAGNFAANLALVGLFKGRFGLGLLFAAFFGLMFLWGVVTSRRIWWLQVRYGSARKSVPLPGVEPELLERFVQILDKNVEGQAR
jgi:hypothetical protein